MVRSAGLVAVEVGGSPSQVGDDWKHRGRSSGGYDSGRPNHVLAHHTASGPNADGWGDVDYCTFHSSSKPLCNLLLARTGIVYVCAAGATNTNGSGHDPCGTTPDDSMNSHAIGIEAGNNGTGEAWPEAQRVAYVQLCWALCLAYNIPVARIHSHEEWAPSRKVDPAGPPLWIDPPKRPGTQIWNMDTFRADVAAFQMGGAVVPPPEPEPEEAEPVRYIAASKGHYWITSDEVWQRKLTRDKAESLIARAKRDAAKGNVLLDMRTGKAVAELDDVSEVNDPADLGALVPNFPT